MQKSMVTSRDFLMPSPCHPSKGTVESMIFLFPRWDMVSFPGTLRYTNMAGWKMEHLKM